MLLWVVQPGWVVVGQVAWCGRRVAGSRGSRVPWPHVATGALNGLFVSESSWGELLQSLGVEKIMLFGCEGLSCGCTGRGLRRSCLDISRKPALGNSSGQVRIAKR